MADRNMCVKPAAHVINNTKNLKQFEIPIIIGTAGTISMSKFFINVDPLTQPMFRGRIISRGGIPPLR